MKIKLVLPEIDKAKFHEEITCERMKAIIKGDFGFMCCLKAKEETWAF